MFEAKLANSGLLKKIVESIKDLVTDASFDCSETSMSLQAMDSSHTALVSLKLEADLFDSYTCTQPTNLGLSLDTLSKVLRCANNDDTCTLKYDGSGDKIQLIFWNYKMVEDVEMKVLDVQNEQISVDRANYGVIAEMPSNYFNKIVKDLSIFGDALRIDASTAGIVFSSEGDIGTNKITVSPSSGYGESVSIEVREPVNVRFSMKFMNQFTKATALSDRVRLSLCNDVPVVVEYPIEENGFLRFYLAPKIDDEENME